MLTLLRRITHLFQSSRLQRELAQELEHHRAMRQEQLERAGLATQDAREVWIWPSLERLWQDVRFGVRMLRRQPAFAAVAILILASGMGGTTSVFSAVEFEIWKPLPFPHP